MTIVIRPAVPADAPQMCDLLNEIIVIGGTTAHQRPFDADRMVRYYIAPERHISTFVAVKAGQIVGFQMLARPDPDLAEMPPGWGYIGSFVRVGMTGRGIGKALFAATRTAALAAGCVDIDATIRADNASGLRYYAGLGFTDYDVIRDVPLRDGTRVDRNRKRISLE